MLNLHIGQRDVEKIRFAYSPLIELFGSYRLLRNPDYFTMYPDWVDEAARAVDQRHFPLMNAIILRDGYVADFLSPTPYTRLQTIEEEIMRVRASPST